MLTQAQISRQIEDLKNKTSISWLVIDASCHLSLRVEPQTGASTFYFRTRKPKQLSRSLGSTNVLSLNEARQKALTFQILLDNGEELPMSQTQVRPQGAKLSLGEILFAWRDHEVKKDAPRWDPNDRKAQVKYEGIIRNHLIPVFKNRPVNNISPEQLEDFLSNLYRSHSSFATSLLNFSLSVRRV